jgi:lipopolysaccharide export system permease protein
MRILHHYLTRQVLATLAMTVLVFTLVLLMGNLLKEILALLISRQATFGLIAKAILLLVPYVFVFALPTGMLTATLLVFGRLSADQELTAVRASGISLLALITPLLLLSVALSGLCGWFHLLIAPQCRVAYKRLLESQGLAQTQAILAENRFIEDIKDWVIYAEKIQGEHLQEVRFYQFQDGEKILDARADEGQWHFDPATREVQISLTNALLFFPIKSDATNAAPDLSETNATRTVSWRLGFTQNFVTNTVLAAGTILAKPLKPKLSDMTFAQLRAEKRELAARGVEAMPVQVQLHRQVAFSFACIGFTLIGIPLGIRAHRRETNISMALAVVLLLVYYSFIILGQSLEGHPRLHPHLLLWIPNLLFQIGGGTWLWRAHRGI